jgi:hypothetical protein
MREFTETTCVASRSRTGPIGSKLGGLGCAIALAIGALTVGLDLREQGRHGIEIFVARCDFDATG